MPISTTKTVKLISGATLLEILVTIGIFLVMTTLVMPISIKQIQSSKLESAVKNMMSMISTAQQNSFNAKNDKNYGISFFSNGYIIFTGVDLANSDSQEVIQLDSSYTVSNVSFNNGLNELTFAKGSLKANTFGTVTITDGSYSYQMTFSPEGVMNVARL